jgi:hypothetical protein
MPQLLLHSVGEFDEAIFEILKQLDPTSILEVGSETGGFSMRLIEHAASRAATLVTIEPSPAPRLVEIARRSENFGLAVDLSVSYLERHGTDASFVILDGDHNWYTVTRELELVDASWNAASTSGVILLHDVGFPCARRDFYYAPETIPAEFRHPYSFELGVVLGSQQLIRGGFRGEGSFAWALHEGGPRNGVLRAIEDFVAARPEYNYRSIDAVFGLGALTKRETREDAIVEAVFSRYDTSLLRRLEQNRLELYLKVIELQDAMARSAAAPITAVAS